MEKTKEKQCEICGEVKPLPEFSKSYRNRCKQCVAEATRRNRANTKAFFRLTAQQQKEELSNGRYFPHPRYELTKIALQGIMAHAEINGMDSRQLAEMAVDIADETLRALSITPVEFENE